MIRVVTRDTSVLSISSCRIELRIVKGNFQSENSRRRCSRGTKFPGETPEHFFFPFATLILNAAKHPSLRQDCLMCVGRHRVGAFVIQVFD